MQKAAKVKEKNKKGLKQIYNKNRNKQYKFTRIKQ